MSHKYTAFHIHIPSLSDEANESKTKSAKSKLKKKLSFRSLNFMKKKGKKEDGDSSKVEEEKKEGEETAAAAEGDKKEETAEKKEEEGEEKKEVGSTRQARAALNSVSKNGRKP